MAFSGWPVEDVTEEENHLLRKVVSVLLEYPGYYLKITDFGSGNNPRLKQLGIEMRDKNPDVKSKKKLTGFLQRYPELFVCYDLLCGPKVYITLIIYPHLSLYHLNAVCPGSFEQINASSIVTTIFYYHNYHLITYRLFPPPTPLRLLDPGISPSGRSIIGLSCLRPQCRSRRQSDRIKSGRI